MTKVASFAGGCAAAVFALASFISTAAVAQTTQSQPAPVIPGQPSDTSQSNSSNHSSQAEAPASHPDDGLVLDKPYARFDDWGLRPTWNIPFPEVGDSVLKDDGGFRSDLAAAGIGLNIINISRITQNFPTINVQIPGAQQYNGQRFTDLVANYFFFSGDLDTILGLKDAKIIAAFDVTAASWNQLGPNYVGLHEFYYEQKLLGGHVDIQAGFICNGTQYAGTFVGGNFEGGTLGPQAIITDEVGLTDQSADAPGLNIRVSGSRFYNKFGVQRSVYPGGVVPQASVDRNGLKFTLSGTSVLFVDEVGYQVNASETEKSMWLRGGGIYNTTKYPRFVPGETEDNYGLYGLADFQLMRNKGGAPFSGVYAGGTVMYAPPAVDLFSQYYEFRVYDVAPFNWRPADITTLVITQNVFSDAARTQYAGLGVPNRHSSTSITASYTFHIIDGLYLGAALGYTRNPAFVDQPGDPNSVTGTLNLTLHL